MLHLDDIIELCLSLVRSEEKQNARRYVEWAAAALRSRERTTLPSQGAGRSWVGPLRPASSRDAQAGTSQKPDPGCVAPSPSGHSPKCPRQRPWAHVVHGDPARDSKLSASPRKIPGARKALAGWQKVGDRAFEPADLIPALADKPFPLLLCAVVG